MDYIITIITTIMLSYPFGTIGLFIIKTKHKQMYSKLSEEIDIELLVRAIYMLSALSANTIYNLIKYY